MKYRLIMVNKFRGSSLDIQAFGRHLFYRTCLECFRTEPFGILPKMPLPIAKHDINGENSK